MMTPRRDGRRGVAGALLVSVIVSAGCKGNTEMTPGSPNGPGPATSRPTVSPDPAIDGQKGSYQGGTVPAPSGSVVPAPSGSVVPPAATTAPPATTTTGPTPPPRRPKVG